MSCSRTLGSQSLSGAEVVESLMCEARQFVIGAGVQSSSVA